MGKGTRKGETEKRRRFFRRIRLRKTAAPLENSTSLRGIARAREERERKTEDKSADADVSSGAREAKTNNAKANILTNFGGGDLSLCSAGILMRRLGSYLFYIPSLSLSSLKNVFMNSRKVATALREPHENLARGNNRRDVSFTPSLYFLSSSSFFLPCFFYSLILTRNMSRLKENIKPHLAQFPLTPTAHKWGLHDFYGHLPFRI